MIHPQERRRKHRGFSTTDGEATATKPADDRFDPGYRTGVADSTPGPATGEGLSRCPVCAFRSDDGDDVYVHLMTAHRKSTISAALLAAE